MPRLENEIFLLPEWGCLRRCRSWKQNKSETKHEIVSLFCGKLNQIYFVLWIGLKAGGQNFTACRVRSRSVSEITVDRHSTLPSSTTLNCSSLDGQPGSSNVKKNSRLWDVIPSNSIIPLTFLHRSLLIAERAKRKIDERADKRDARCLRWPFKVFGIFYGNAPTPLKAFRWNFPFSLFFASNKCTACGFGLFRV